MDKRGLRAKLRHSAAELDDDYVNHADAEIFRRLTALPELLAAGTVFTYLSVGRELDTRRLIDWALARGMTVALPVPLADRRMEFRLYTGETEPGPLGIPVPPADGTVQPKAGDVAVVPGLAFDADGYRIGQGGGYYDRFLAENSLFSVGLCRESFFMERVPREGHDLPVRCVVTEKRTARPE